MRLPDFLIIGGMRCASTSLANFLRRTGGVYVADGKEVCFFDRHFDRGPDWYAARFPVGRDVVAGEATTTYLSCAQVPERVRSVLPGANLVAILRDPVARAYSHYWHSVARGRETLPFLEAVQAEDRGLDERARRYPHHRTYLDRSRYGRHLARFVRVFPAEQVRVLILEEITMQPRAQLGELIRWLVPTVGGLSQLELPPWPAQDNRYVRFRSVRVRNLVQRMPRPVARVVGRANSVREEYPAIPDDAAAWVRRALAPDRAVLERLLGREVSVWR